MLRILIIVMFFCLSVKADQYDQRLENLFSQLLITENETKILFDVGESSNLDNKSYMSKWAKKSKKAILL